MVQSRADLIPGENLWLENCCLLTFSNQSDGAWAILSRRTGEDMGIQMRTGWKLMQPTKPHISPKENVEKRFPSTHFDQIALRVWWHCESPFSIHLKAPIRIANHSTPLHSVLRWNVRDLVRCLCKVSENRLISTCCWFKSVSVFM